KRRFDPSEVVVTVAHRVILQQKLASERSVAVERHRRGAVEFFVGKGTDCRGRRRTVAFQQSECSFFGDVVILFCVIAVYRIDDVPCHTGDRLAGSEQTRKPDLNRIHTGDVVHHYANLPAVFWKARLPLRFGKRGRKSNKRCCSGLETGGEGLGPVVELY